MRDGNEWVLVGEKTYISNGGIADFYVPSRAPAKAQARAGFSAFIVPADAVDGRRAHRGHRPAPARAPDVRHVRIPADALLGEPGEASASAMETLDLFRVTVGAAALGFARRALDEALSFATSRRLGVARSPTIRHPGQARRHGARRSMPPRC